MREIKFRVWDRSQNKMRSEGFAVYSRPRWKNGIHSGLFLEPDLVVPSMDRTCGEWNADSEDGTIVLQQFTGLKDKNGEEIYEGDILAIDNEWVEPEGSAQYVSHVENYLVAWGPWDGGDYETETWILEGPQHAEFWHDLHPGDLCEHAEDSELIGNIYENPELLEKP
jgi:uncharacterized phage protein (TIGR01671 family)